VPEVFPPGHAHDVLPQIVDHVIAHGQPEILAGHILKFMGFVEDDRFVLGNDGREIVFLHRQVGEEQVMVDDNDVRGHRSPLHFRYEAAFELGTLLSGAEFSPSVHLRPRGRMFG
jgi:hypothetical protein